MFPLHQVAAVLGSTRVVDASGVADGSGTSRRPNSSITSSTDIRLEGNADMANAVDLSYTQTHQGSSSSSSVHGSPTDSSDCVVLGHYACFKCHGRGQRFRTSKKGISALARHARFAAATDGATQHQQRKKLKTGVDAHADSAIATDSAGGDAPSIAPAPGAAQVPEVSSDANHQPAGQPSVTQNPPPPPKIIAELCAFCRGTGLLPASSFSAASSPFAPATPPSHSHVPSSSPPSSSSPPPVPAPAPDAPFIAIAGAGIGGTALALALLQRGMRVVVYERDASFDARAQGYGLTMQQGAAALGSLGVTAWGVSSSSHYSFDPAGNVIGCYGRALYSKTRAWRDGPKQQPGDKRHNIHLPRQRLRRLLLDALPREGIIRWGVKVEGYQDDDSGRGSAVNNDDAISSGAAAMPQPPPHLHSSSAVDHHQSRGITLCLSDGTTQRAALLVAADGFHSGIRRSKVGDDVRYLGVMVVLGYAPCSHPLFKQRVCQTLDGNTRIYTMPFTGSHGQEEAIRPSAPPPAADVDVAVGGALSLETSPPATPSAVPGSASYDDHSSDDTTMWQLSFPISESDAKALAAAGPSALRDEALMRCGGWHEPIPSLLHATPASAVTGYPAYDRDLPSIEVMRWGKQGTAVSASAGTASSGSGSSSLVTMIGDAAHPMSPFKGQGANQALLDAVALAKALNDSEIGWRRGQVGPGLDRRAPTTVGPQHQQHPDHHIHTLADSLLAFETDMLRRAATKVIESRENAAFLHTPAAMAPINCTRAHAAAAAQGQLDATEVRRYEMSALTEDEYAAAVADVAKLLRAENAPGPC